jgi:hypothetical protein
MARLLIHVEGQTEEAFVKEVLRDHLVSKGYYSVEPRIVGNARQMGGICSWPSARRDIINHLKEDQGCIATTMVDYYGLPQEEPNGWPGRDQSGGLASVKQKALCVQEAMRDDLGTGMDHRFDTRRFVPFVIMHEFEGLLFSDCSSFSRAIDRPDLETNLQAIRNAFATPEEINDSAVTAPSKRIKALVEAIRSRFTASWQH